MISTETLRNEEALVISYQTSGCSKAFGELYQMFYRSLYDYMCKISNNSDDAFDLTQETFITVAQEIHKLRQPVTFRFWLFRIAKHKCMKKYRQSAKEFTDWYEEDNAIQNYDISEAIDREKAFEKLDTILSTLTPEDKLLLIEKYGEGKSIKEIMTQSALGSSAVKMKLMRARQKVASGMAMVS